MMLCHLWVALVLLNLVSLSSGGPLAYAACQAACAAGAAAIAGTTAFFGVPLAMAAYSACQAACVPLLLAPTP